MIASLRGTVIDKGLDYVTIECAGVGYQCSGTATTIAELPRGEEVFVTTALVVREDSQTLYVFKDADEKRAFATLQSVSGVGARLALAILSVITPQELARAVSNGDHKTLQRAPGVGKRLAERMAVDLKGKVADLGEIADTGAVGAAGAVGDGGDGQAVAPDVREQVLEALVGLGFTESKAGTTIEAVLSQWSAPQAPDASGLLRASLAAIK
ncbi:Holliday junction DNA helicase RuvA [Corynebacterium jeikeium]|jgi:holliday junction DNA helicase RuvA|uniref:Holliday junction branch migration complex subunit RuvA n=1 Tax=Corynebacterium jeikeium (strain K411) TaxID=306537 RepID=RUVA_CORJK|nr:Holliday junction branch migration protein RuvA [Corynebacterium jeikeium]Q4JVD8.1 RecName: Full=Holliday junction branch migration complex subunit RuvA [Corynebacterium jeikeium K411]CAI37219.1 holliday junction DNA helicase [Corynebacterium jeikeium K411]SQI20967.1 Holliday junction DNA helicase RuvA [Corynebacterium jeikeium]SUY85425.1 Holliday junction DNA helicase RuvA [Corynebacterium jeikeium]